MATSLTPVQSGNVITANLMNQVIGALTDLDTRVSKLEGTATTTAAAPHILTISPQSNVHVGDSMTVTGTHLWAAGLNAVYIDLNGTLTQVTSFTTQSDTQLTFNIPTVFVQAGGSSVYLRVISPTLGSDSAQFTLLPATVTIPTGEITVQLSALPNTVFNAPATGVSNYTLNYRISANTTLGDTYSLNPTVTAPGWSAAILNSGIPVANAILYIPAAPSASQPSISTGSLQLTIPAGATGSANLVLTVVSHLNPSGLTVSSPTAVVPVGGSVLLSNGIGVMPEPPAANLDANGNLLVPVAGLQLRFLITVTTVGLYNLSYSFNNSGWTASVPTTIQINTANLPTPLATVITPSAGAAPSNFSLTVALSTDTTGTVITQVFYPVVLRS
jgi:hypothetical protein